MARTADRPRLAEDLEERMAACDERSAACYADAESLSRDLRLLAADISMDDDEAVPEEWPDEESTLPHRIEELRRRTQPPRELSRHVAAALAKPAPTEEKKT